MAQNEENYGPIPVWSEAQFVVNCQSLHVIDNSLSGPNQYQDSDDPTLFHFREPTLCPRCFRQIDIVRAILPSQVRNFDLSLGQAVSGQITKVLNSSSIRRHHQGLEVDNRYGNPVQQAVARPDTESAAGRSSTSTPGGESRGLKGLLETFIKSRASRLPEDTRQDGNSISFPSAMSFCFSSTGQAILAWQKGEKFLVRMVISPRSDRDGRGLDIDQIISDTAPDGPVKIQYAAEGDGIIAIVAFRGSNGLELALLHESGVLASENSYLRLDETSCAPTCMSISPDNAFVAIGFGQQLFLAYFDGRLIHKIPPVPVPGTSDKSVRFQVCSFSAGSDWLILSTQSQHHTQVSREDDTVETCAWQTGLRTLRPRILSKCHMPTNGRGLSTVYFHPGLSRAFITGSECTSPYPVILTQEPEQSQPLHSMREHRIRCVATCPMPDHHIVYYLDFQEQIFSVNMQSRQIEFVADIRRGRGFLKVSEQPATMSIRQSDGSRVIVIFWKRGLGLWCIEVQAMSRNVSRTCNVRDLWDGAVGIEEDQASVST